MALYTCYNASVPASSAASIAPVKVTTGTTVKTLLQIGIPSTQDITIVEWGISFDGAAAAQAIECELFNCTGAATVSPVSPSALDAAGHNRASACIAGTSATGFSATSEGTPANYFSYDLQLVDPAIGYFKQFPSDVRPYGPVSTFVRVRVTAPAAVYAYCYITWLE